MASRPFGFLTLSLFALAAISAPAIAQTKSAPPRPAPKQAPAKPAAKPPAKTIPSPASATTSGSAAQQLETLARQLDEKRTPAAYQQLAQFAAAQAKSPLGPRAALALGYYDCKEKRYPEARKWLEKAAADPLLGDYALYWTGMTDRATGANDLALSEFQQYRQHFPEGVMTDSAVEELARAALAVARPQDAVAALDTYEKTKSRAALVLLRAQAHEQVAAANAEPPLAAAIDYLDVYYRFPLGEEAGTAAVRLPVLQFALGEQFPGTPLGTQIARAEALNQAGRWNDLRSAYRELLPKVSGVAHERAQLRIARANAELGSGLAELASLELSDPDLDSERLYLLSQEYRAKELEGNMLETIEQAAQKYPQSPSTADALFAAGNYFWMKLDRPRAAEYYARVVAAVPASPNAAVAQWRVLWTGYMARNEVRDQIERYLRQYPNSPYVVDALYFLGRANERAGNLPHARSMYAAAMERFPQTYFGGYAASRLRQVGAEPTNPAEFLALFPLAAPLPPFNKGIPPSAGGRWTRALALRGIAFDQSAEQELRAANDRSPATGLLYAISEAAAAARRYPVSIIAARQLLPRLDARQYDDVPQEIWRIVYPWPYRTQIEREATRNKLDPMLVAGLIRQESAFAADAISVSDALGLMQVWPPTGTRLARTLKLGYSRTRLFDPDYNLRLGAYYLSSLLNMFGKPEYAVAAYNAGENRVVEWTAGQNYEELPEFVESIPITQTRDYVQIVLRNAGLYRRIYSAPRAVTASAAAPATPQRR
jgi:soluble lytic murein transglycosylase